MELILKALIGTIGIVGILIIEAVIIVTLLRISAYIVPEPEDHPLRATKVSQCALLLDGVIH